VFGSTLRAVGLERDAIEATLRALPRETPVVWREVPARLDDVFIHLLRSQEMAA
jgi:hypothetical protein